MSNIEFEVEIPVGDPLKAQEKAKIIDEITSSLQKAGIEARVLGSHYIERRGAVEVLGLIVSLIAVMADVTTIVMAIWALLKEKKSDKKIRLKTKNISLSIEGRMSKEEVLSIIEKAEKAGNC